MMGFYADIVSDNVAPPWLQQGANGQGPGVAGRYLQACGTALDTMALRGQQAAYVSLPGVGDPSGLPFIGLDRVMVQGASEPNATFALRLTGAFDAWQHGGSQWGALQQVLALFTGFAGGTPPARTVSNAAVWDYYAAGASTATPPIHVLASPKNWNWDGGAEVTGLVPGATPWWRYWLILDSAGGSAWTTTEGNWGAAGNWGDGTASWGLSVPPAILVTIRTVLRSWQSANAWCRWIVINFTAGQYAPDAANALPDGTWGPWSKLVAGVWVQARDTGTRFADGVIAGS